MNMKKLMALLLSLMLVIGLLPTGALAEGTDYELRVLTFEDADYKGSTNFAGGNNWTTLIDSPQYGGAMPARYRACAGVLQQYLFCLARSRRLR